MQKKKQEVTLAKSSHQLAGLTTLLLTQDGDSGVEPALLVEEPRAFHLGEGLVGVRVVGRTLDPSPVANRGVAPCQSILSEVEVSRAFYLR